jgi:hypothetical protein
MPIADEWSDVLRANAAGYIEVALANIAREFPSDMHHTMRAPAARADARLFRQL